MSVSACPFQHLQSLDDDQTLTLWCLEGGTHKREILQANFRHSTGIDRSSVIRAWVEVNMHEHDRSFVDGAYQLAMAQLNVLAGVGSDRERAIARQAAFMVEESFHPMIIANAVGEAD